MCKEKFVKWSNIGLLDRKYLELCPTWPDGRRNHDFIRNSFRKSEQIFYSILMHDLRILLRAYLIRQADRIVDFERVRKSIFSFCAHFLALIVVPAKEKWLAGRDVISHQPESDALRAQPVRLRYAAKVFVSVLIRWKESVSTFNLISFFVYSNV